MAASTVVAPPRRIPGPPLRRLPAPGGSAGLAPVIPLRLGAPAEAPAARPAPARSGPESPAAVPGATPDLRLVTRPRRQARRRSVALALLAALVIGVGGVGAAARAGDVTPAVGGQVVLQPGETLWDVAVRSAPPGTDPRRQLTALRTLNAFPRGAAIPAWTVVLLPA